MKKNKIIALKHSTLLAVMYGVKWDREEAKDSPFHPRSKNCYWKITFTFSEEGERKNVDVCKWYYMFSRLSRSPKSETTI